MCSIAKWNPARQFKFGVLYPVIPERVPHPLDRMEVLKRVIKVAQSIRDLDSVLEILMDHVIELFGAERGFIMLVDNESGALEFRTARNFSRQGLYDEDFQVSRSIVFKSFGNGETLLTSNAQTDDRFSEAHSIKAYGLRSVICAPLLGENGPIGLSMPTTGFVWALSKMTTYPF